MGKGTRLDVLYQDEWLVAVNKPAGLLVHRSRIDAGNHLAALQLVRNQLGRRVYPLHRLDKPTAGVLLFALSSDAARQVMPLFEAGAVKKTYLAVARGWLQGDGRIDYPLREEQDKIADALANPDKAAQAAITDYECLATTELAIPVGRYDTARYTLLRLHPRTGRRHQLRRHLKHIFHPLVGDTTHGDGAHNRLFRARFDCRRLLLHAASIEFHHPLSEERVAVTAPLDAEYERVLRELGWAEVAGQYGAGIIEPPTSESKTASTVRQET